MADLAYERDSGIVWWCIHTGAAAIARVFRLDTRPSGMQQMECRRAFAYLMASVVVIHLSRCEHLCFARYVEWIRDHPLDPDHTWGGEQYERWAYQLHVHANEQKDGYIAPPFEMVQTFYGTEREWWSDQHVYRNDQELIFKLTTLIPRAPPDLWKEVRHEYRGFDATYGTPYGW